MIKTLELVTHDFQGDLFIDIGANVGMWSTEMVGLYNKIIYVEPGNTSIATGKERIQAICDLKKVPFENITFLKNVCSDVAGKEFSLTAMGADTGNLSIFAEELYGSASVTMREDKIVSITLDDLINYVDKDAKKIFIKIDTEGADLDVLLGGFKFIEQFKPDIFVEAHYHMYFDNDKHQRVFDFLFSQGYELTEYKMDGYRFQPDRVFDGKHNGIEMYDRHFQMMLLQPTDQ
jgi:FkbM family methyltransferase